MSGIAFKPFRLGSGVPNICVSCNKEMRSGLYHKIAGVAEQKFHGIHEECLVHEIKEGRANCPLCKERVSSISGFPIAVIRWNLKLVSAVKSNDLEEVRTLLAKNNNLLPKTALLQAAQKGFIDIVRLFLTHYDWSGDEIEDAVYEAAANNHLEMIRLLLGGRSIPEMNLGPAVCVSAECGHFDVLHLLLEQSTISDETAGAAARLASGLRSAEMINLLLKGRKLSEALRGKDMLSEHVKNLPIETIDWLSRGFALSEMECFRVARFGPLRNHPNFIRYFASQNNIAEEERKDLILCATHTGDDECIRQLLEGPKVPGNFLLHATRFACTNNQFKIAGLLSSSYFTKTRPLLTFSAVSLAALGALEGLRRRYKAKS